jgi:hypothetical protein
MNIDRDPFIDKLQEQLKATLTRELRGKIEPAPVQQSMKGNTVREVGLEDALRELLELEKKTTSS